MTTYYFMNGQRYDNEKAVGQAYADLDVRDRRSILTDALEVLAEAPIVQELAWSLAGDLIDAHKDYDYFDKAVGELECRAMRSGPQKQGSLGAEFVQEVE